MRIVNLTIILLTLYFTACSQVGKPKKNLLKKEKLLSCEEKAAPKSLQFLEQQYRCTAKQGR